MGKQILAEGPDISKHNGTVNIKQIRDSGYRRIGIRAGYGKNNVDQRYIANAQACYNLGVDALLYWFSYAYTVDMAETEAGYAIAQAKKFWNRCPIAFDFEYDSVNYARKNNVNITKQLATDMAIAFLEIVQAAGYIPVIYTNRDYMRNYFDLQRILTEVGDVYVWYARYTSALPASEAEVADIWQYTSSGRITGVSGNVDLNRFYTEFDGQCSKADRKPTCNINILDFQRAANMDEYRDADGNKLVEDGIDGARTQYVRRRITLQAKKIGNEWKVGSIGHLVEWWQKRCNEILGHDYREIDGMYGQKTRSETIALQKRLNLDADGIAGYNSIQAVFYN